MPYVVSLGLFHFCSGAVNPLSVSGITSTITVAQLHLVLGVQSFWFDCNLVLRDFRQPRDCQSIIGQILKATDRLEILENAPAYFAQMTQIGWLTLGHRIQEFRRFGGHQVIAQLGGHGRSPVVNVEIREMCVPQRVLKPASEFSNSVRKKWKQYVMR